ncbi:hypothetical protein IR012_10230 [Pseudomonas putida]|uniref:hypothetical protein n=1 Tax=Pseudomonas putida TaxID=303 RepID=UPI0018AC6C5A|nr:hypothetical protein [Pseudomonas putida]MBF8669735.1 hypothetical protein [Pseudomonas putida]MBF8712685.1 hypothetical protein [Pseudomonas putida]
MTDDDKTALNEFIDQHNLSQEKTVARATDLVKTLLLLSGGALAVCANFFSAKVALPPSTVAPVQFAWVSLTSAIVLFGVVLTVMLARDYLFGEIVDRQIRAMKSGDPDPDEPEPSNTWDAVMWSTGLLGLAAFITGMACFTYAAWRFLNEQIPMLG